MILDDLRAIRLKDWLENDLLLEIRHIAPASSDASFRRYFRIETDAGKQIVMDAPPEKENLPAFIQVAELISTAGARVPAIYQQNLEDGFLLLEDFGTQCFLDQLNANSVGTLYNNALASLVNLQTNIPPDACGLNRYDHALLARELAIFADWFIGGHLDASLPDALWASVCDTLAASALAQPATYVHRDFHSRNLMVLADQQPGIIDFQDAVIGPVTYDAVSLLRDCYIAWPEEQIAAFREAYFQQLLAARLVDCPPAQFQRWFDLMGMQRHLKAIGIFARLHLRDGKANYLNDIPRTLHYVLRVCDGYAEFAEFGGFLRQQVLPNLRAAS